MTLIVTPIKTTKNGKVTHVIRIENIPGDEIELNIKPGDSSDLLVDILNEHAETFTIIKDTKGG